MNRESLIQEYRDLMTQKGCQIDLRHRTRTDRVEIEVTTKCNLKCFACNRFCSEAASNEHMTEAQVTRFVDESMRLGKRWDQLVIIGGEPTLHPELKDILGQITRLRAFHSGTRFVFCTNGAGERVRESLKLVPSYFEISNTNPLKSTAKSKIIPEFGNSLLAPIDRIRDAVRTCQITATCGLGLSRYGYFPCGCGASVARVLGLDIGIKRLEDVSANACAEQLKLLCAFCGRNLEYAVKLSQDASISPFWERNLQRYRNLRHTFPLTEY